MIDGGAQYFLDPATRNPVCTPCWTGVPMSQINVVSEQDPMSNRVLAGSAAPPLVTQSVSQQFHQHLVAPQIVSQHHGVVQQHVVPQNAVPMQLPSHISPILQPPPTLQPQSLPHPVPYPVEHQAAAPAVSGSSGPRLLGPFTGPPPPGAMIVPVA